MRGVFWSGAQVWGSRVTTFVVFVILSRLLTPEDFGLVAMASVFLALVETFQDQGFGDAIVQRADLQDEHLDTAFWTNLIFGILLTLVGISASPIMADLFHEPSLKPIIQWLSPSFLLAGLGSTQQAILRRHLAFKELAIRSLLASLVGGFAGVTLAFMGFGVWSLVVNRIVTGFVGVVVLWNVSHWRPRLRFSRRHFHSLFSFGFNVAGINILNFLNRRSADFLIGYFLGPIMLGFYTVAYRLLLAITDLLTSVTNAVAYPTFSRLQNEPERLRRTFIKIVRFTSLASFPAFIGVAVVAPELIYTLFGPQWTLSIPVARILAFIGILHSVFYFNNSLVKALGKPSWRLRITLLNAVSNVAAFAIAVRWGIIAVAAAYVIRGYSTSPVELWMIRKLLKVEIRTYLGQFLVPLAGSAAMAVVTIGLKLIFVDTLSIQLQLALYVIVGGFAYLFVVHLIEPSNWRQIKVLLQTLRPPWLFPGLQKS
jgi:PST family polysaccharide transporter